MGYIFEYICANYPRFVQQVPITAIRVSKRIAFVELFDFLFIWIIDIIIFKRSVRIFIDRIYDYKRFPQLISISVNKIHFLLELRRLDRDHQLLFHFQINLIIYPS